MTALLKELRKKVVIGFVGGSDMAKIAEQLVVDGEPGKYRPWALVPQGLNGPRIANSGQ